MPAPVLARSALNRSGNDGFAVFVQTLPYRFYCYFAIAMVFIVAITRPITGWAAACHRLVSASDR